MKSPLGGTSRLDTRRPGRIGGSTARAKKVTASELRREYHCADFSALARGIYVERLRGSSNVVVLEPEVASLFPNAAAVNGALRSLVEIARHLAKLRKKGKP